MDKEDLTPIPTKAPRSSALRKAAVVAVVGAAALGGLASTSSPLSLFSLAPSAVDRELLNKASCPVQVAPLNSSGFNWTPLDDEEYQKLAIDRLSRAVQIPHESYDSFPRDINPEDPIWAGLIKMNAFLDEEFPTVQEALEVEMVNTFARLYTWKGSKPELQPILLMAHMDVVPVPASTRSRWTYDPFSGHLDENGWMWGRGVADCKNTLMAILGSVEKLLKDGFKPERTIILAFGYDEEIGGDRGAQPLTKLIEERYGKDGLAFLVDEGFTGVDEAYGATFASLGLAEKGSVNLLLQVDSLGGHSSVPPVHTSIGVLSMLLTEMEAHAFIPTLQAGSPYLQSLQCYSDFGEEMPKHLKHSIKNPKKWPALAKQLSKDRTLAAWLATTQAIDLIQGGVKSNALPETTSAVINYRIDFLSSVDETVAHVVDLLTPLVKKLNLTFDVAGSHANTTVDVVRLHIEGTEHGLEPAPITPTEGAAFELVAGTTRHVFPESIVTPSAMIANTDTKWTWGLTKHIYRFVPASLALIANFHTVDERIAMEAHFTSTAWFYQLLANSNGWKN